MAKALFDASRVNRTNLIESAPVTGGGIVSKPLLDAAGLRQIVFAMDAGQTISEHRAPYTAVVQMLDGRMRLGAGEAQYEMGPHDWLVMPPDQPHDLEALEPTRLLLTLVKGDGRAAAS
jgi:quercetin dioxygenase-like cupin family protein